MRKLKWLLMILFVGIGVPAVIAQECQAIVDDVLEMSSTACEATGRNEVCYGHDSVSAEASADSDPFNFDEQGDIVGLQAINTMELSPFDETSWGIVIVRAQAQIPDTIPGQNVTIVLVGDVEFENEGFAGDGIHAFHFDTGISAGRCSDLTTLDGIMIQTPEAAGLITLSINGTEVTLGSTAFFQTITHGDDLTALRISMLDGNGFITVADDTTRIDAAEQTHIVLDENLNAAEPPTPAESFDTAELATLYEFVQSLEFEDAACMVATDSADSAALHVGPGTNRTQRAWLEPNQPVTVTGVSDDGLWWQLDKFEAFPAGADSVLELWVAVADVTTSGDCSGIQSASAPPIVAPVQPTAATTEEANVSTDPQARINYWADNYVLNSDNPCTNINWDIEYVNAIYLVEASLGTIPLTGISNSYWVCPSGTTTYYIRVIYNDRSSQDFPITLHFE
jgi:hypothetical protein